MDQLLCEEDLLDLLEVPAAEENMLETPRELAEHNSDGEELAGRLPTRCDEDHSTRLHVLLTREAGQLTTDYLRRQPGLDDTHRFSIVQWLHVACFHFKLNLSALAIAVRLLDRFLDVHMIPKEQVSSAQCVAVACLTIAAKLDGPDAVDNVAKFQVQTPVWFTAFSAADIRAMELTILSALDWWSMCATPVDFLDCLMCLANIGRNDEGVLADGGRPATTIRHIAQELIIQTLKESQSITMKPSCMAAGAILAAMHFCYGAGHELASAFYSFAFFLDQEEMQSAWDQLTNNCSAQAAEALRPRQPRPAAAHAVNIPIKAPPPSSSYSKDECSPTSVLVAAASLPSPELLSFEF